MATTTLPAKKKGVASSSIGLKFLMAGSGVIFLLYVLLHMYGNLMALGGQETFDTYAHHLRTFGEPMLPYGGMLWTVRVVLILSIIAHVYAGMTLWARAGSARPQKYAVKKNLGSTLASRTMRWGGLAILVFVIWHLIHFTLVKPAINSSVSAQAVEESPFVMVQASFELWWMVLIYALAMIALGMHLYHGIWSAAQTMGLTTTAVARRRAKSLGAILGIVIVVGFLIPPFAILFNLIA
ncbi:succinate dehydrogenase cytochrome b subunit [Janibacter alittae]|uniref:Succinate dehydrogenase cytochrome b subunit n=1 Tax=Janibacter alittae TaxID=3115209 RepID=A0ABZ2MFG9_9MICO